MTGQKTACTPWNDNALYNSFHEMTLRYDQNLNAVTAPRCWVSRALATTYISNPKAKVGGVFEYKFDPATYYFLQNICSKISEAITKAEEGRIVFNEPQRHFNTTIIEFDHLLISIFFAEYAR